MIHGFASSPDAMHALESPVRALGLPYQIPILRGHAAASPEALRGVTWHDWQSDCESALQDLMQEVERAIVIGHSLGGSLALLLAADHADKIDSLVLAAAAIQPASALAPGRPLGFLLPLLGLLLKRWDLPPTYTDMTLARSDTDYRWAPMDAILSSIAFTAVARRRLADVRTPALILQSRKDGFVAPVSAEIIDGAITTAPESKHIIWFEKTDHEIFRDCERETAVQVVMNYIQDRMKMERSKVLPA